MAIYESSLNKILACGLSCFAFIPTIPLPHPKSKIFLKDPIEYIQEKNEFQYLICLWK